jgi:hypothetical protein
MSFWAWVSANWVTFCVFVVPIVVSAVVAIYVAAKAARYQMDHRDYDREKEASQAFLEGIDTLDIGELAKVANEDETQAWLRVYWDAEAAYVKAIRAPNWLQVFFTSQSTAFSRAAKAATQGKWDWPVESDVGQRLILLREVVEDWPYPELRASAMRKILKSEASGPDRAPAALPVALQVDLWMLSAFPSPYLPVRRWKALTMKIRLLAYNIRREGLSTVISNATTERKYSRQAHKAARDEYRREQGR